MSEIARILAVALVTASVALASAAGVDHRLAAAYRRGDRDALADAARARPARALAEAMWRGNRAARIAAIAAAPSSADPWLLLEPLAALARARDRRVAAMAARSATAIARELSPEAVEEQELPHDALAHRRHLWRRVAEDPGRWPDVRVHALEIVAALHLALGDPDASPYPLAQALADPDPELRRAALELLPIPLEPALRRQVAAQLIDDPDPAVALVAAQVVCTELGLDGDPAAALAALGDHGLARVRELVVAADAPAGAAYDAARCLAADPDDASADALRQLATRAPAPMRPRVQALLEERGRR